MALPGTAAVRRILNMPAFGHAMLEHWMLEPESIYLNHGTVGANDSHGPLAAQSVTNLHVACAELADFAVRSAVNFAAGRRAHKLSHGHGS